ncbi:hypothetical protein BDZ45DRAFT_737946 [Acephala macrosclerotiorum]|nr:hypothetical protein BDZ45DRAFT_737946 [Acephala macrosclerotiorum]
MVGWFFGNSTRRLDLIEAFPLFSLRIYWPLSEALWDIATSGFTNVRNSSSSNEKDFDDRVEEDAWDDWHVKVRPWNLKEPAEEEQHEKSAQAKDTTIVYSIIAESLKLIDHSNSSKTGVFTLFPKLPTEKPS